MTTGAPRVVAMRRKVAGRSGAGLRSLIRTIKTFSSALESAPGLQGTHTSGTVVAPGPPVRVSPITPTTTLDDHSICPTLEFQLISIVCPMGLVPANHFAAAARLITATGGPC